MNDINDLKNLKFDDIEKLSIYYIDERVRLSLPAKQVIKVNYDNMFVFIGYAVNSLKKFMLCISANKNYVKSDFGSDKKILFEIEMNGNKVIDIYLDLNCKYLEIGDFEYAVNSNVCKKEFDNMISKYFRIR